MKKLILTVTIIASSFASFAQVGIGTTSPHASAILEISSTTKGFLPPRMNKTEMDLITNVTGLMVYCTNCIPKGLFYSTEGAFVSVMNGVVSIPAAITLETDEIYSATGKIWKDRNLGASQVATTSNDYLSYGNLYQWGRGSDGHEVIVWTTATTSDGTEKARETAINAPSATPGHPDFIVEPDEPYDWLVNKDDTLWQGISGTNNPCPAGFRIPTETELNNELALFHSKNTSGAFNSILILPSTGYRTSTTGNLTNTASFGYYWSSTTTSTEARYLYLANASANMGGSFRGHGFSIRCIKD